MNPEYQRLAAEATLLEKQIQEMSETAKFASAAELAEFEKRLQYLSQQRAACFQGMALIRRVHSPEMAKREAEFIKDVPQKYHSQGRRPKVVHLAAGVTVTLEITYYHRVRRPTACQRGRRGLFPMLLLLGIVDGYTSYTRQRIATSAALLGSYEEAASMLFAEGIRVSVNQIRHVAAGVGAMMSRMTKLNLLTASADVKGRRIVVSVDGGRVRLRERRRGKSKRGHKRFRPAWREPRLFIIYAVDENGEMADDFAAIIDGGMQSCDQLFALMRAYLNGLHVADAARVLFVADGASWIWRRIPALIKALNLTEEQTQQLIDIWHAVEYLGKLADSKSMPAAQKKRWLNTQKKRLKRGELAAVIDELKRVLGSRRTKNQTTWLNYFLHHGLNDERMAYGQALHRKLPIGSGAIESAIRRVINLRVKSNAVYWLRENAQTIIRIRAWIKALRAQELFTKTSCITPQLAA